MSYFDLQKYRKYRAKQRACPPEYKTVVDVSDCIDVLYNYFNNHLTKGKKPLKELFWSSWLERVRNDCRSQGLDIPKTSGIQTYGAYDKVCSLSKFTRTFLFSTKKERDTEVWRKVCYKLREEDLKTPLQATANNTASCSVQMTTEHVKTRNDERPSSTLIALSSHEATAIIRELCKRVKILEDEHQKHVKIQKYLNTNDESIFITDRKGNCELRCETVELDLRGFAQKRKEAAEASAIA